MALPNIPTIDPSDNLHLEYLAEGAANIIYRIIPPPPSPGANTAADIDIDIDAISEAEGEEERTSPPPLPSTTFTLSGNTSTNHSERRRRQRQQPPDPQTALTAKTPLTHDPRLAGKLVRLRKSKSKSNQSDKNNNNNNISGTDGKGTSVPVLESHRFFQQLIAPCFPAEQLVPQTLFHPTRALLQLLNRQLRSMEGEAVRPERRCGGYLDEGEVHGLLVGDMTCPAAPAGEGTAVEEMGIGRCVEFKPKWLAQSPNAPVGSRRCRTCALRAMERAEEGGRGGQVEEHGRAFCPLGLVSWDQGRVSEVVERVMRKGRAGPGLGLSDGAIESKEKELRDRVTQFLHQSPLLETLRRKQLDYDPDGVLGADVLDRKFLAAMTLRDCTLFLKIPLHADGKIEARLGDLDLKSARGEKAAYWIEIEQALVEGGWYTATETRSSRGDGAVKMVGENEVLCQLS